MYSNYNNYLQSTPFSILIYYNLQMYISLIILCQICKYLVVDMNIGIIFYMTFV